VPIKDKPLGIKDYRSRTRYALVEKYLKTGGVSTAAHAPQLYDSKVDPVKRRVINFRTLLAKIMPCGKVARRQQEKDIKNKKDFLHFAASRVKKER
jgi:hypothetical protein